LTVVEALEDGFSAAIIPHTEAVTTLASKRKGERVNIEVDVTAKYIEKLITWNGADGVTAGTTR
jgi:riboflavin synthase